MTPGSDSSCAGPVAHLFLFLGVLCGGWTFPTFEGRTDVCPSVPGSLFARMATLRPLWLRRFLGFRTPLGLFLDNFERWLSFLQPCPGLLI